MRKVSDVNSPENTLLVLSLLYLNNTAVQAYVLQYISVCLFVFICQASLSTEKTLYKKTIIIYL